MIKGLVLVKLQPGREQGAVRGIKEIGGVKQVEAVFGRWDLVLTVSAKDVSTLTSTVVKKIRAVPGIFTTETLITTTL